MNEIKSLQMLVLGERDMPLSPMVRLQGEFNQTLTALVEEGQRRLPDLSYEDVLRLVLRTGIVQVQRVLNAEGRIERGGHASFPPSSHSGKAANRLDAIRTSVIKEGGLVEHNILVPTSASLVPPQTSKPKDTVSTANVNAGA